ncbi:putative ABC transport system ATP-binding protein [Thermanaeromonas toyohensis ToBE]|uniref:Putative ABC transport system ATP-binding protein n=1 Tax=Thermanaeromonas toyohensis ToBE TaxID=698762 RepID=A0A1W1V8D9_9FIRM|nr:ABC transporter ATP-binding protein [Thermanaeromonas toyohensis]SMB89628.1 putative ABC transport system ATP-binding protein [Thermanaeromonas toyohensis ToBE]
MSKVLIEVEGLTKIYKQGGNHGVVALRDVSFTISRGEMVAIMGPSGSGKSTLMHILGCLDKPDKGRYILAGKDVTLMDTFELASIRNRYIGFVFQNFNLLGRATALENVALPLVYARVGRKERERRARYVLQTLGLAGREHHLPNQLSGGQQQRVAIGRALINNPELLLADEPTGQLDSKASADIMYLLQTFHRERGLTIVIVTHEPDIAYHCQRILRLRDGILVAEERVTEPKIAEPSMDILQGQVNGSWSS